MADTYSKIRQWIDVIFTKNGKKYINGEHANTGFKKVLGKIEDLESSKAKAGGIASLNDDGKVPAEQLEIEIPPNTGNAYMLELSENPSYYTNGTVKAIKYQYVSEPEKFNEQRFEYNNGIVSKIEIKDDISGKFVRHVNIFDQHQQLIKPTITDITEFSIT